MLNRLKIKGLSRPLTTPHIFISASSASASFSKAFSNKTSSFKPACSMTVLALACGLVSGVSQAAVQSAKQADGSVAPVSVAPVSVAPASVAITTSTYQPVSGESCVTLESSTERLSCYDAFFNRPATQIAQAASIEKAQAEVLATPITQMSSEQVKASVLARLDPREWFKGAAAYDPTISLLDRRWELSHAAKLGTFHVKSYKPSYVLPVFITGNVNDLPYSPNPENQVSSAEDINRVEGKFQLSLKTKAVEGVFGDYGDLWVGYTQSSRWQVYNSENSRPFRETNYEPEASLIFGTNYNLFGLNGRLLGLSLNHQSNGRELPFSRSWNRVIANIGFERDNFALMLRPWYRIPEDNPVKDDNPDIKDYMGRGDLQAFYRYKQHEFSLMLRHSLKGGDNNHGAAQFDWVFPIRGGLRGYMQVFDGYGESLIDYNHRATYVGVGVSLLNWY